MKTLRILWIEDKQEQIGRFVERLQENDMEVTAVTMEVTIATNGEAALDALEQARQAKQAFDVVLLDIMLPKGDGDAIDPSVRPELMGEEIARQMQKRKYRTPLIGITCVADDDLYDRIHKKYHHVSDFLKKPIKLDELTAVISAAVTAAKQESTQT